MLRIVLTLAVAACVGAPAPASAEAPLEPSVLIAFHPGGIGPGSRTVFDRLAARPKLSFGMLGATQGPYSVRQTLLDITQGSRLSRSGYDPGTPPRLTLQASRIDGWRQAVERADSAPAPIVPGLLASSVDGGAGYVAVDGFSVSNVEAVVAADREGRIEEVSIGPETDIAQRAHGMLARRRLVVVALPEGRDGDRALTYLQRQRSPGQLLLVIRKPPRSRATQLLPMAAGGLRGEKEPGLITSRTTRRDGFVAGIDLLPTVLDHLRVPLPDDVRGRPITVTADRGRDVAYVRRLDRRLRVVYPRRFPAVYALLASVAFTLLIGGLALGRRRAARGAALAVLWLPALSLLTAAFAPGRGVELLVIGPGSVLFGLLTDRFVRWPRAPAVPALLGIAGYVVDLIAGSPLIVRSLMGPNPRFGARFYGIGNELEAILPVLLLVGIAAAVGAMPRSRRLAAIFGVSMLALGAVVGAGRFGADVGGVITIGAGGAAAVLAALPGRPSWPVIIAACAVPVLAIGMLAIIDIVSGGDAHFTSTVLGAEDSDALLDIVRRRTELAVNALARGLMPLATLLALAALVWGFRHRDEIVPPDGPAWGAALAGGAAGGVVGSLANDSGPVLLVLGMVVLVTAVAYLRNQ